MSRPALSPPTPRASPSVRVQQPAQVLGAHADEPQRCCATRLAQHAPLAVRSPISRRSRRAPARFAAASARAQPPSAARRSSARICSQSSRAMSVRSATSRRSASKAARSAAAPGRGRSSRAMLAADSSRLRAARRVLRLRRAFCARSACARARARGDERELITLYAPGWRLARRDRRRRGSRRRRPTRRRMIWSALAARGLLVAVVARVEGRRDDRERQDAIPATTVPATCAPSANLWLSVALALTVLVGLLILGDRRPEEPLGQAALAPRREPLRLELV